MDQAQLRAVQTQYAQQRAAMDPGLAEHVAPFELVRLRDGRWVSYAPLADGIATLVPKVDLIAFTGIVNGRRWSMLVPWDDVFEVCPLLFQQMPNLTPVRFRAHRFPTAAALQALAPRAVLGEPPR